MPEEKPFEIKWKTYTHIFHPYGDLLWHLFWGILIGWGLILAIINHDFWFLVITLIGLIFFFHPKFYEPRLIEIKLTEKGVYVDKMFYPWKNFYAFEIFSNDLRKFVFLFTTKFSFGVHFPLEEFFVNEEEVKNFLNKYLKEHKGEVPLIDKLYRVFFL